MGKVIAGITMSLDGFVQDQTGAWHVFIRILPR